MKKILSIVLSLIMLLTSVGGSLYAYALDISYGVDVSEYNQNVDYDYVKSQDKSFVMIRLGYYNHLDPLFWENVKKACDADLDYGVYLYSYAYSVDEALVEAEFVIDTLSQLGDYAENFTLPVAYDMEDSSQTKYGKTQLTNQMTAFCDKIKTAGYVPMIYSNLNWFNNYINLNTAVSKGYKIWYAYWLNNGVKPNVTEEIKIGNSKVTPDMWQYMGVDYASPTVFDENLIYYTSELVNQLSCYHSYTKKATQTATAAADGKYVSTCSLCGNSFSGVIPKASAITINNNLFTYSGSAQKPVVTVKDRNGTVLTEGKDYSLTYPNSVNAGSYTVKVTLKGLYSGTKSLSYNIKPRTPVISSVKPVANGFTVNWGKRAETTGYQIQYATKADFSNAATVYGGAANTTSKTITGRAAGTKYYVRVRTYKNINGNYIWGAWSASKNVTTPTKPANTSITSVSGVKNGFTVKWNKVSNTTGYQIQYSTRSDFKNAATVYGGAANTTSKTITGRAAGTKYYVRVRTYKNVNGTYVWGNWTSAKAVTTKK